MKKNDYFLTYHAIERFKERFPEQAAAHCLISQWDKSQGIQPVKPFFDSLISESEENKSHFNDTQRMTYLYEKYGFDQEFKFIENFSINILFLMIKSRSDKSFKLATVMPTSFKPKHILTNKNRTYNKKKEHRTQQIELKKTELLTTYDQLKKTLFLFQNEDLHPLIRLRDIEKEKEFHIFYKDTLLKILTQLNKQNLFFSTPENLRVLKSECYDYYLKKNEKNKQLELLKMTPSTASNILDVTNTFSTLIELYERFNESILLCHDNQQISQRQLTVNHQSCVFKYDNQQKIIVSFNLLTKKQYEQFTYCLHMNLPT